MYSLVALEGPVEEVEEDREGQLLGGVSNGLVTSLATLTTTSKSRAIEISGSEYR